MLSDAPRVSPVPAEFVQSIPRAVADVNVPAYVLDPHGRARWLNEAAREIAGDCVGKSFVDELEMDPAVARATFSRRLTGADEGDHSVVIVGPDGERRRVEISSVRLRRGHRVIGMFGLAVP